jgi:flagellin
MGLRINNNAPTMGASNNLQSVMKQMTEVQERLTSGKRLNKASDGPADLIISKRLESQLAGLGQAQKNVETGMNLFTHADKTLETIEGQLKEAKTLALASLDATKSDEERTALNQQLTEIISSVDKIASSAKFGKVSLLDGTFTSKKFQIGDSATDTYTASINDMRATALGINSSAVDTVTNAGTALTAIEGAMEDVSSERGRLGSIGRNTFQPVLDNLKIQQENLESARSTIADTNYEKDTAEMQRLNVRMQIAAAMLSATSQQSGLVLNLLG